MFDPKTIAAQLDARVLVAALTVPPSDPIEAVAAAAGVTMATLRGSMHRLTLRVPGKTWAWAGVSDLDQVPPYLWPAERLAVMV